MKLLELPGCNSHNKPVTPNPGVLFPEHTSKPAEPKDLGLLLESVCSQVSVKVSVPCKSLEDLHFIRNKFLYA